MNDSRGERMGRARPWIPKKLQHVVREIGYTQLVVAAGVDAAIRHHTISDQASAINAALRGHYAYYGVAGNFRSLIKLYPVVERYWREMLCSRSRDGGRLNWGAFHQIKERTSLLQPKLRLPYRALQALAVL